MCVGVSVGGRGGGGRRRGKVRPKVSCYFFKVASLVFLDITQDCSLEQSLTSSKDETSINK